MPKYKSPEAYILKLESFNTYLSIPRVLSLNSVKKILEPILLWKGRKPVTCIYIDLVEISIENK